MIRRLLNNLSRIVLAAGALVIVAMVLFPPWRYVVVVKGSHTDAPAGYAFVLRPPKPDDMPEDIYPGRAISVKMDDQRLIAQMVGVVLVCGMLFFAVRKKQIAS